MKRSAWFVIGIVTLILANASRNYAGTASFQGLGDLPGGNFGSRAWGISADGAVVVGYGAATSGQEAFRWTSGTGMVGLGDLHGGDFYSTAYGTSADGAVIVGFGSTASGFEAFRWTSAGGMVGLGDLPGGIFYSEATDVSADGSVAVGRSRSAVRDEAFRWTSGGGMVGLGDLPGGIFESRAYATSADGSVVVGLGNSGSGMEAFIWEPGSGMQSLRDRLVNDFGLDLTGWQLTGAFGVSADGLTIVGYGADPDGFNEGWIVTLPVPDDDDDDDGVPDEFDVCPGTRAGLPVTPDGRPLRDCNGDCLFDAADIQCIVDELLN